MKENSAENAASMLFTGEILDIKPKKGKQTMIEIKIATSFTEFKWNSLGELLVKEKIEIKLTDATKQLDLQFAKKEEKEEQGYEIVDEDMAEAAVDFEEGEGKAVDAL